VTVLPLLPDAVAIRDVGPRDGLQPERPVAPEDRARLVAALAAAGLRRIEAVAFVSPAAVPAMAGAAEVLADPAIDRLVVTDAVPAFRLEGAPVRDKVEILPAAPLLAEAIRRLHHGEALTDLFVF
jgi:ribose-phosphate pyrophosphokinase